jgi:hypothetical protein
MNLAPDPTALESQSLAGQPVVSIRTVVPIDQPEAGMGARTGALLGYVRLQTQSRAAPGPPREAHHRFEPGRDPAEQDSGQWAAQLVQPTA